MTPADHPAPTDSPYTLHHLWRRAADRLAAADPAYSRFRRASRATLALGLTAGVLAAGAQIRSLPTVDYGLAAIGAFVGSVAVRDTDWKAQGITRAIAGVAMVCSAFMASVLAPLPLLAAAGFLLVVFVSVYIRRYGQRWTAVGILGFMAYFMADYFHPRPGDIGWELFAAALAMTTAQIACCVLLPDHQEQDFRRALRSIDQRIERILEYLLGAAEAGSLPRYDARLMRRQANQLRETVLMAEGFIPDIVGSDDHEPDRGAMLATALFNLQMAVERLIRGRQEALPPARALRQAIADYGRPRPRSCASDLPIALIERVLANREKIGRLLRPDSSPFAALPAARKSPAQPSAAPAGAPARRSIVPESLHRPIQVTVACGLALTIGISISSTRWYWAIVTAFIVFNNTKTRTDAAIRAAQRAAGTLGGVVAGALIAVLLQHQPTVAELLIVPLCFLAIYFQQTSYGLMIFFVTIALALLYGLMGSFTSQLLALRLVETLVGGASGMIAAFFVFPVYTFKEGGVAFRAFLDAFRDVLEGFRRLATGKGDIAELIGLSRQLDRRYADLAGTMRPIGGPWAVVTRFGHVREKLLLLLACTHWVRDLCRAIETHDDMTPQALSELLPLVDRVEGKLDLAKKQATRWFQASRGPDLAGAPLIPPTESIDTEDEKPRTALAALDLLMTRALLTAGVDARQ